MSQQEENGNPVPNETSADSPQNGAVLASYQRGGDVESKICYKLLVAALTFFHQHWQLFFLTYILKVIWHIIKFSMLSFRIHSILS